MYMEYIRFCNDGQYKSTGVRDLLKVRSKERTPEIKVKILLSNETTKISYICQVSFKNFRRPATDNWLDQRLRERVTMTVHSESRHGTKYLKCLDKPNQGPNHFNLVLV